MEKYRLKIGDQVLDVELEKVADDPIVIDPPAPSNTGFVIGCNTFPWVPLSRFADMGMKAVRCYCPWHWFSSEKGLFIEPMRQAYTNEAPGLDTYLANAAKLGIDVLPSFNQCPEWLRSTGNGTGGNDYPPIKAGKDRLNPASYSEYADFLFQIAARYGKTKHPDSELRIDTTPQYPNQPANVKKSGLGLLRMIQVGNELDHWFDGFASEKYMKPEEHAAMLSACYAAIKKGDSNMIVVMGGITDFNIPYLKSMWAWSVAHGSPMCDVIDAHHYSNKGNKPGTDKPTWIDNGACLPKEDAAFSQINEIVALAKSIGKRCFVSEFGADVKTPSQMAIVGGEAAQANLIVETFKAYKVAGVDAAYVFTAIDHFDSANGGLFRTSGIMTSQADGMKPKPACGAIKKLIESQA